MSDTHTVTNPWPELAMGLSLMMGFPTYLPAVAPGDPA